MDLEKIKEFLASDEAKPILEEIKAPVVSKNNELLSELAQLKELKKSLESFGGLEKIKETFEKAKNLETTTTKKDESFEALKSHLETELKKREDTIESFKQKFTQTRTESLLDMAIAENKGVKELLKPLLKDRVRASLGESDVEIEILNDDGKPMFVDGRPATVNDLLASMKKNPIYARAFEGSGSQGTGARQSNGSGSGSVITDPKHPQYSLQAHMAWLKSNGKA
jgi:hypothetical protein